MDFLKDYSSAVECPICKRLTSEYNYLIYREKIENVIDNILFQFETTDENVNRIVFKITEYLKKELEF